MPKAVLDVIVDLMREHDLNDVTIDLGIGITGGAVATGYIAGDWTASLCTPNITVELCADTFRFIVHLTDDGANGVVGKSVCEITEVSDLIGEYKHMDLNSERWTAPGGEAE